MAPLRGIDYHLGFLFLWALTYRTQYVYRTGQVGRKPFRRFSICTSGRGNHHMRVSSNAFSYTSLHSCFLLN